MSSPSRRAISRTTSGSRQSAASEASDVRIGVGDRDQARPDQGRQVVVGGVLGARDQRPGQRRRADSTGSRCSVEASTSRTRPDGSSRAMAASFAEQVGGQLDVRPDPPAEDGVERQVVGQQPDRPGADRFVLVVEQSRGGTASSAPPMTYSDQSARSLRDRVGVLVEESCGAPSWPRSSGSPRADAVGQHAPGLADEPFVRVPVQGDQLALVELRQVADRDARGLPVSDLVDPARGAVDAVVVVALAGVAPVEDEDAAVGPVAQVDAAEPGVGGEEDVGLVAADVAAARRARAARR